MRTPGRCTNFETCWLANGRRDIRVMVGDPFVCPACGEPLHAPSIDSISTHGLAGALAISLAMVATAGGAGFGVVRLAQTAGHGSRTAAHVQAAQKVSVAVMEQAAPKLGTELVGTTAITPNPLRQTQTLQMAASVPALQMDPTVPPVVYVAAAPEHKLVLPINFGRPQAPEDDAPATSTSWHHHAFSSHSHRYSEPASVWSADDEDSAQPGTAVPQADADSTSASLGAAPAEPAGDTVPAETATAAPADTATVVPAETVTAVPAETATAVPAEGGDSVVAPADQGDTEIPSATHVSYTRSDSDFAPAQITRLIVPAVAVARGETPAYQPASRVDPDEAEQADRSADAPYRLATLHSANPARLAVPAYPAQQEEDDRAGRVDVGCVITKRGLPSGCEVQRQEGGRSFAHSVMSWLRSGSVRYRPGVVSGEPVQESRDYRVSFQP